MKVKTPVIAIALLLFLNSCSKSDTPDVYATEQFPQKAILVIDNENDPVFYDYLYSLGTDVIRAKVETDDDKVDYLYNSGHAHECVWIAHIAGPGLYYFQLASDTNSYLLAGPNPTDNTQYMLYSSRKGFHQEELFRAHDTKRENGVKIMTLESYAYPKHYFSHEGVGVLNNGIRLNKQEHSENAVRVRWYPRDL